MFLRFIHSGCRHRSESFIERAVQLDSVPLEAAQIFGFVIRLVVLPATPQNSQPLETHDSNRCPAALALAHLVLIEQASPLTFGQGTLGKLHDALVQENRSSIAELHDLLSATLLLNRCHTTEAQQVAGL